MPVGLSWSPRSQRDNMPDDPSLSWNSDTPWSEVDDRDLAWCRNDGQTIDEIADFLCRTREEVTTRIEALGLRKPVTP
jgi:hypothetical protein